MMGAIHDRGVDRRQSVLKAWIGAIFRCTRAASAAKPRREVLTRPFGSGRDLTKRLRSKSRRREKHASSKSELRAPKFGRNSGG